MRDSSVIQPQDYFLALRNLSYPHYFCLLLTDPHSRQSVVEFWHVAAQIRRIPTLIREPTSGYIRLTWWRDHYSDPDIISFINAFEFWFEPQSLENALIFAENSEYFFVRHTLKLLNVSVNENLVFHFSLCFGLILLLQNQALLTFSLTDKDKQTLTDCFDDSFKMISKAKAQQADLHLLKPLIGYLTIWRNNYSGEPTTFGPSRIQWHLLKVKWLR